MPKLHELLAVEGNLKTQADKVRTELTATFEKKTHLFGEKIVSYRADGEGVEPVIESQLDLQSTISKELKWITPFLVSALDVSFQVAEANTTARGDVTLDDGTPLLSQIPATALLELEKRARELQALITAIPTLDPAKGFRLDTEKGADIYKAREVTETRTKKVQRPLTLAKATDKHPEQVQLITEDVPVGKITKLEWSGLITPAAKADMLTRAENFLRAVKQARSRANEVNIEKKDAHIGGAIIAYVFG